MKKMVVLFLILSFLFSCSSSKHYIKKGRFDDAVKKSVKLLRKNPEKEKEIVHLAEAFRQANQQNQDKILFYKKSGQPDIWDEVYDQYVALRDRENLVKTVSQSVLDQIGFQYVDYDSDIQAAEKKACEYYYAHARQLLEKNDKYAARQAYDELTRIKRHFSDYKDVDNLRSEAYNKGMTRVFFRMINDSRMVIPEEFEQDILQMNTSDLNQQWTTFYTSDPGDMTFDYDIIFFLKTVMVGPSKVRESEHEEKREIEDGWVYLYDKNGNVKKDSLGNDIKVPRYVQISCKVLEGWQEKECMLGGTIAWFTGNNQNPFESDPLSVNFVFRNYYAALKGDPRALSPETYKKVHNAAPGPAPFPSDPDMIMNAADGLKSQITDVIERKMDLLK